MNNQPTPDGGTIDPVRFRPTPAAKGEGGRTFTPRRIIAFVAIAAAAWFLWFIFTAKSVRLDVSPAVATLHIEGGFAFPLGDIHLMRTGSYRVQASAPGYFELSQRIQVGSNRNQTVSLPLAPHPGRVTFSIDPPGAFVAVVGVQDLGGTAPVELSVPAGPQVALVSHPLYLDGSVEFAVQGRDQTQTVTLALAPNWADVTIPTTPSGAVVRIDDQRVSIATPGPVPVPAGEHRIALTVPGYKTWSDILHVDAGEAVTLPAIVLEAADGTLRVRSTPEGAGITVDGAYAGVTSLEIGIDADRSHTIRVFKIGYAPEDATLTLASGQHRVLEFALQALEGTLSIETRPGGAELWIDGKHRGAATGEITLAAVPHDVEIRKEGHAGFRTTVELQPDITHELKVELLTLQEARLEALKRVRTSGQGHELVLLSPGEIRMGASRREPGRRANEVLRDVELTRLFYLGRHEVTNGQFRKFATGHASGQFENMDLDEDQQPVAGVSWRDAALYCNWLSDQDDLQPFYLEEFGKVIGFNPGALGYRLPTEAEWAWAARWLEGGELLLFPWGDKLPPPDRHGNYADQSATHTVSRIIFGFNDNYIASAPVGSFEPNDKGIYDLGGNVAEWVHDYYEIPKAVAVVDPLGPQRGEYHVIRGASWMHGTVTDLRLSFRDYGTDGRPDVGFRIARFAE